MSAALATSNLPVSFLSETSRLRAELESSAAQGDIAFAIDDTLSCAFKVGVSSSKQGAAELLLKNLLSNGYVLDEPVRFAGRGNFGESFDKIWTCVVTLPYFEVGVGSARISVGIGSNPARYVKCL